MIVVIDATLADVYIASTGISHNAMTGTIATWTRALLLRDQKSYETGCEQTWKERDSKQAWVVVIKDSQQPQCGGGTDNRAESVRSQECRYEHRGNFMRPIGEQACQPDTKHSAIQPALVCMVPRDSEFGRRGCHLSDSHGTSLRASFGRVRRRQITKITG